MSMGVPFLDIFRVATENCTAETTLRAYMSTCRCFFKKLYEMHPELFAEFKPDVFYSDALIQSMQKGSFMTVMHACFNLRTRDSARSKVGNISGFSKRGASCFSAEDNETMRGLFTELSACNYGFPPVPTPARARSISISSSASSSRASTVSVIVKEPEAEVEPVNDAQVIDDLLVEEDTHIAQLTAEIQKLTLLKQRREERKALQAQLAQLQQELGL